MSVSTRTPQPIKAALALRDIKVSDAARRIGVSEHWLGRVVNGHQRPSEHLLDALTDLLGQDARDLFIEDDTDDVVVALVRRTRAASGVPAQLEDDAAAETVATILRAGR